MSSQAKVRVVVCDDSIFMRRAITRMLSSDPGVEIVGQAKTGEEALSLCDELKPDVLTLDIEMPVMDGLTALRKLRIRMRGEAPSVLMCSSLTKDGSHEALRALRLGAADVIGKDPREVGAGNEAFRDDLVKKVRAIAEAPMRRSGRIVGAASLGGGVRRVSGAAGAPGATSGEVKEPPELRGSRFSLVAIGSSTGGPPVLERLITALPASLSVSVVVAQHMPAMFTKSLAERLDQQAAVTVVHGEHGMPVLPGAVYIAPGGEHTRVVRTAGTGRPRLEIGVEPSAAHYRPSVNELFRTAGELMGPKALGVMLTGMGEDGLEGSHVLKARGGVLLAQSASSCVVYGMPRAVIEAGLADGVLPPERLAGVLGGLAPEMVGAA